MANPNNAANVSTGKPKAAGAIFAAPRGTAIPTNATAALTSAFVNLGLISDEGLKNLPVSSVQEFKEWGGQTVYSSVASSSDKFSFELIEVLNEDVLKQVFGPSKVTTGEGTMSAAKSGDDLPSYVWAIEVLLNGGVLKRIVIPSGKVTSVGEIAYKPGELIKYAIELAAAPDIVGNTHYEYFTGLPVIEG
jgi:hypothetical protein